MYPSTLGGANKYQKGFFNYMHQVGKAVAKRDWYRAAELVVTCPGSSVPGISCPKIEEKEVAAAIQNPINIEKIMGWIRRHIIGGKDWWGNPFVPLNKVRELDQAIQRELPNVQSGGALTPEEEIAILEQTLPIPEPEPDFLRRNIVPITVGGGVLFIGIILMVLLVKV